MTVVFFVLSVVFIINVDYGESYPSNFQRQYGDYGQYETKTPFLKTQDTNGKQHLVIVDHDSPYQNSESYSKNIGNGHNSQNKVVNPDDTGTEQYVLHATTYDGRTRSETVSNDEKPDDCDDGISISIKPDGSRVYNIGNGGSNKNVVVIGHKVYTNNEARTKTTSHMDTNYASQDKSNGNSNDGTTTTKTQNSNGQHNIISDNSAYPNYDGYTINIGNGIHRINNVVISQGTGGEAEEHTQTSNGYPQGSQGRRPDGIKTLNFGNGNENVDVIGQKENTNNEPRIRTETNDFASHDKSNGNSNDGTTTTKTQNSNGQHNIISDKSTYPNYDGYTTNIGNGNQRRNDVVISQDIGGEVEVHTQTFNGYPQGSHGRRPGGIKTLNFGNGNERNVIGQRENTNNEPRIRTETYDFARENDRNVDDKYEKTPLIKPNNTNEIQHSVIVDDNIPYPNTNSYSVNIDNAYNGQNNKEIHAQTYNGYPQGSQGNVPNNDYFPKDTDEINTGPGGTGILNTGNGGSNENSVNIGEKRTNSESKFQLRGNFDDTHPNVNDGNINMLVGKGKDNQNFVYSDS